MEAPPKNSVVAYWVDIDNYSDYVPWEKAAHYILLDPISPGSTIYNATKIFRSGATCSVRIQLEVPGYSRLVNEDEYKELYKDIALVIEKTKMWRILKN